MVASGGGSTSTANLASTNTACHCLPLSAHILALALPPDIHLHFFSLAHILLYPRHSTWRRPIWFAGSDSMA